MRKYINIIKKPLFLGITIFSFCLLFPHLVSTYYVGLAIQMLIMSIFAMSLDLLLGYTGLPSLGQAAYFGVAGYTTAFLWLAGVKNIWLVMVLGVGVAGITAAFFGLFAIRALGPYFFIITLALAEVLWGIAFKWRNLTGGDDGLPGIRRPEIGMNFALVGDVPFYYFTLFIFLIVLLFLLILTSSPFGYVLRGIRESESRMKALGYNVWRYKYQAFIFSGCFAGISGVLWIYYNGFVSPADLGLFTSAKALLMVILGGAGTLFGPAIGAGVIIFLENIVSALTERWLLLLGTIYVLAVMFFSEGIFSKIREMRRKHEGATDR